MIISNCTKRDIDSALEVINQRYKGNIKLNNYQQLSKTGLRHRVTLRVIDSHSLGAHLSLYGMRFGGKPRHTTSACWHAHGYFFGALPHNTKIQTRGQAIMAGDMWDDFNVGSLMFPIYASESCSCGEV